MSTNLDDTLTQTIIQTITEKNPQDVNQLVSLVQAKAHLSEKQIFNTILKLQNQGKITLERQSPLPPSTMITYLKTRQALWYLMTTALATLNMIFVFFFPENLYPWSIIRNFLGAIFVLFLPGYAFMKALFPRTVPQRLSTDSLELIELIALSFGISLALVPFVGLLLNYTPWGIHLTPIVLSLFILTLIFANVALMREHKIKLKA